MKYAGRSVLAVALVSCCSLLFAASPTQAVTTCTPITKTTAAGTFTGEVCVDPAAGTVYVHGEATLTGGGQVVVEAEGTVSLTRTKGKPTFTLTGSILITDAETGDIILDLDLTATGGTLTLTVSTFAGQVVDLALP
jgi:hypothetical protein